MTNTPNRYLITMRPLDDYYFGGKQTLGGGKLTNYLALSRKLPQQTTLLGMLRHYFFTQQEAIGPQSFNGTPGQDFGVIQQLSPVFLRKQTEVATTNYLFAKKVLTESKPISIKLVDVAPDQVFLSESQPACKIQDFNVKKGLATVLLSNQDEVDPEEVFIESTKIGIKRSKEKGKVVSTEQSGFFKQKLYRLAKNWSFAFLVDLQAGIQLPAHWTMPIGGERKLFALTAAKHDVKFEEIFPATTFKISVKEGQEAVVLCSDALVGEDVYQNCRLAITETVPFRNLYTPKGSKVNYADLDRSGQRKSTALRKSRSFNLLKRGSVLFPKPGKLADLKAAFEHPAYQKIGYNSVVELK